MHGTACFPAMLDILRDPEFDKRERDYKLVVAERAPQRDRNSGSVRIKSGPRPSATH